MKNIQFCHIDAVDRSKGTFEVTAHSDDLDQLAVFRCSSEHAAIKLRDAIREHADKLRRVADYRVRKVAR